MKNDYEKLKEFAEELRCGNDDIQFKFQGEDVAWNSAYTKDIDVSYSDGRVCIKNNDKYISYVPDNLDQWINETREYWRERGLPSLQGKSCSINHDTCYVCDECLPKPLPTKTKGKLYEMPNTVVNLKTQEEYDEFKEIADWKLNDYDINYNYYSLWREGGTFSKKYLIENTNHNILTLPELKSRIGVEKKQYFNAKSCIEAIETLQYKWVFDDVQKKPFYNITGNFNKTNAVKPAKSIMNTIKDTAKRLLLTEPEKTYVKAGLMDIDKNWQSDALETAQEQMLADYMDTKGFKDQMTKVAKELLKDK